MDYYVLINSIYNYLLTDIWYGDWLKFKQTILKIELISIEYLSYQ